MSTFRLEKWYLNLADASGNALICYSASLRFAAINLNYNGYTFRLSSSTLITKQNSFRPTQTVHQDNGFIGWTVGSQHAQWKKIDEKIDEVLLANEDGEIRWICEFPKANGSARLSSCMIEGYGYAEKIIITIPPWRIPIKELHWGRFLSDNFTIIWIKWIGPIPKSLLFANGKKINGAEINANSIVFEDSNINIYNKRTLRKGTILSTVFSRFKTIRSLFPKQIMSLSENKWISDGTLSINGDQYRGTIIHEVVVWP
jgi:hypothetical protein